MKSLNKSIFILVCTNYLTILSGVLVKWVGGCGLSPYFPFGNYAINFYNKLCNSNVIVIVM